MLNERSCAVFVAVTSAVFDANVPSLRPPGFPDMSTSCRGGNRLERPHIAELRRRRVVPEQTVAAARHDHRDVDDGIALPEVEIVALDVQLAFLTLAESVQGFVRARLPELLNVVGLLALDSRGLDAPAAGRFGEDRSSAAVGKRDGAVASHHHTKLRRAERDARVGRIERPGRRCGKRGAAAGVD